MYNTNENNILPSEDIFLQKAFETVISKASLKIKEVQLCITVAAKSFHNLASATAGYCELTLKLCENDTAKAKLNRDSFTFGNHKQPTKTLKAINVAIETSINEVKEALSLPEDVLFNKKRLLATILLSIAGIANSRLLENEELALKSN